MPPFRSPWTFGLAALTFAGLIVGFGGAGYCTWKGLKGFTWLPR